MKKKAAIIIPYFGKLPRNMVTFLKSCATNPLIKWFIFTDQEFGMYKVPKNVKFINTTFNEVRGRIKKAVGEQNIVLHKPYKLCDYRPAYGIAFNDYVQNYDYWGYSDIDVVYGNLLKFIHKGMEEEYDKIGDWGHFTLFKNTPSVNNRFRLPIKENGQERFLHKDAFNTKESMQFDEIRGIDKIYEYYKYPVYRNINLMNDLLFENKDLLTNDKRFIKRPSVFVWENGKANFYYQGEKGKIKVQEFGYFHFHKRSFVKFIDNYDVKDFAIVTDGYYPLKTVNQQIISEMMKLNHSSFNERLRHLCHIYFQTNEFTDRKVLGVYLPIKYILWRIIKEKNFAI